MKYISADYIKAIMKGDRLLQGNCEYELWKQEVDKKVDAMPSIEVMDVVTAYQQGWCDALDASINALNDAKFQLAKADRKTENSSEKPNNCDTCRNKGFEGCEQPCLGCGCCGLYEAMTENDKLKEKVVDFIKTCARCKHRPIGAMMCEESCHYEPQPTTQTETQNSNLTFEKDECAKEYEELGLKELKELIEADRKTEPQTEREGE